MSRRMNGPEARYLCIHGHFYQPPRENPWLEVIEAQESAAPFHDWNERITAECYAPNAAARVLSGDGRIAVRNNYERISFNFGPTLLIWMQAAHPEVYTQILRADRISERRFGHGNALAQVYGHCILPLASEVDRTTQVRWGIADFIHRFGRDPEGMWLPETAVDLASLQTLAEHGIRFTILAPSQARRVRHGHGPWVETARSPLDTLRPYRCRLAHGKEIVIFFYEGDPAHDIAFNGLLHDGVAMARRLMERVTAAPAGALISVATDGESYGHHHRFGEMALAAALDAVDASQGVQLTNYASYLARQAVHDEVEIHEQSAWSCAHGIERWRSDCGCHTGGQPGWNQAWRAPLRSSLEWLKGELDTLFVERGAALFHDPWAARNDYIHILLAVHETSLDERYREQLLAQHGRAASAAAANESWRLLEMQRFGLLCFTSCAWFFDDCAGIETTQILIYAARAIELAAALGRGLEADFLERLAAMHSNLPGRPDGRKLYDQLIRPRQSRRRVHAP